MTYVRYDYASPIGALTLVSDGVGLAGLYFENHKVGGPPKDAAPGTDAVIEKTRKQLDAFFAGRRTSFDLALAPRGTPFQTKVWDALARIGFGETRTYSQIANEIGAPKAVRAVGAAVGRNKVSIIVPCHRVLGSDGSLTGFAGGTERKRFLLDLEQAALARAPSH